MSTGDMAATCFLRLCMLTTIIMYIMFQHNFDELLRYTTTQLIKHLNSGQVESPLRNCSCSRPSWQGRGQDFYRGFQKQYKSNQQLLRDFQYLTESKLNKLLFSAQSYGSSINCAIDWSYESGTINKMCMHSMDLFYMPQSNEVHIKTHVKFTDTLRLYVKYYFT